MWPLIAAGIVVIVLAIAGVVPSWLVGLGIGLVVVAAFFRAR